MKRCIVLAIVGAAWLTAAPVAAAPTPTPSPSLDSILAAPPSGYTRETSVGISGEFTAHDLVTGDGAAGPFEESALNKDGFVDGYRLVWQSNGHILAEAIIAFGGGKGARDWLSLNEASYAMYTTYQHADTITGIDPYFGAHLMYTSAGGPSSADDFAFVKGNDFFQIAAASSKDDNLSTAASQAMAQYQGAPAQTIPVSRWPENSGASARSSSSINLAYGAGYAIGGLLAAGLIAGLVLLVIALVRRRPAAAPAGFGPSGVHLSGDGRYWWDGRAWKDAEHEAPPSAQRSGDGAMWWDGRTWRPVPSAAAPPPPSSAP